MTSNVVVMETRVARKSKARLPDLDLRPYAGRWVALVGRCVAGVGLTAEEARIAAKLSRPKEEPEVHFVPDQQPNTIHTELA